MKTSSRFWQSNCTHVAWLSIAWKSTRVKKIKQNKIQMYTNCDRWVGSCFFISISLSLSLSLCVPRYIQVPDAIFSHIYFKFSMEEIKYIGNCSGTNISIIPLNVYIKTVCSECSWKLTTEPNQKKLVLINKKVLQYYHNPKLKKICIYKPTQNWNKNPKRIQIIFFV